VSGWAEDDLDLNPTQTSRFLYFYYWNKSNFLKIIYQLNSLFILDRIDVNLEQLELALIMGINNL